MIPLLTRIEPQAAGRLAAVEGELRTEREDGAATPTLTLTIAPTPTPDPNASPYFNRNPNP